jgi:sugar phosphate isomerase/epimerase
MPPVEFVKLAADVGCSCVGINLIPTRYYNPNGYPNWSLRDDPVLRREMVAALRDRGVRIALLDALGLTPDGNVRDLAFELDLLVELEGERVNVMSMDRDAGRTLDGFATLAEMAGERGLEVVIEIGAGWVKGLPAALAAVNHVARPNFRLLVDTMHYFRPGGTIAEIAAIDPTLIGYVQFCDAPQISSFASYMEEALHERMVPGTGDLPLREFLAMVPPDVVISVEIPQRSLAEAGIGPKERVAACVEATRRLLASIEANTSAE